MAFSEQSNLKEKKCNNVNQESHWFWTQNAQNEQFKKQSQSNYSVKLLMTMINGFKYSHVLIQTPSAFERWAIEL